MITFIPTKHLVEVYCNHQHVGDVIFHPDGDPEFSSNGMVNLRAHDLDFIRQQMESLTITQELKREGLSEYL